MESPLNDTKIAPLLKTLPAKPGVYLMKDVTGRVIYVGKAVSLRNRVRSYFHDLSGLYARTRQLVMETADLEYIVTQTELEALILECTLIKKHRPRFNVRLKDDKNYLYIKTDVQNPWPRVFTTRRMLPDGARYFGPFASSQSVRETLDLLRKLFPYITCDREITGQDNRPCLYYYIHRCLGPCIGKATPEEYRLVIDGVVRFLEGKQEKVVADLRERMTMAAESLQFERAAAYRDQLQAIERVTAKQKVLTSRLVDQDVIALARANSDACVEVFFIRGGKLTGREHFALEGTQGSDDGEVLRSFVQQFYDSAPQVPPEIILPDALDEMRVIEEWLHRKRGTKVSFTVPRRGAKRELVQMATENAAEALAQLRAQWLADAQKTGSALVELQEQLNLPTMPLRIECYDISNIQGTSAVGSMVVFEKGVPKNSDYRRFQIKTVAGANDYAMLQEVLRRRFKRQRKSEVRPQSEGAGLEKREEAAPADTWAILPDLLIVDGGKGQLSAAREVMVELGVDHIPTVGLAKEHEELFAPGNPEPIVLPRTSQSLYLVQRIRDEAHRFALAYHQRLRKARGLRSALDDVPGIGPKRKAAMLKRFGSVKGIREASVEDLAAVPGMTKALAEKVKEYL
ncbi:MAG: excinuclease ABC subunit UvrC [Chloroflexi bacterium]|nr:excinuclease ABC subunit UvrC [Chloroflexota bacterium]